ncbi:MAG: cupin domain-containing protein [Candidatus Marinimicrobia bacterium]|jgi:mannose-6-phosphate isomerase-like protein (cupin superfamily)|nr:cupin domain-containing protein [Candidatus Neomarinimicrobiota bacterium]MBT3823609.1 cupin domain-containing protein [Candidatus Neomarinimicrobiota bacterium]MBT4129532.1 cupin domain-containing protein [Candidatus Neomarinimicrobiota bacterium]MBT4295942.1 cupin domain-containing protein [Candidatus Neomarinimicrobiota bacterium]MBT4420056.1 cupin domain-containing protein [Candidatus Neomarinimicrobiota bacterium]
MKLVNLKELPQDSVSHNPRIKKQVILKYHEIGNISTLAQSAYPPGEKVEEHVHKDLIEIFIVQSGSGVITIEGSHYDLMTGITVVVEAGERHALENTGLDQLVLQYFGISL